MSVAMIAVMAAHMMMTLVRWALAAAIVWGLTVGWEIAGSGVIVPTSRLVAIGVLA